MTDRNASIPPHGIVVVTGPAGAGRTTAIHALEDFGYEAIDNLPMTLFEQLSGLRDRADILIDTSDLSPHDLRARLAEWFAQDEHNTLSVLVQSFAFKRGTPRGLDMMLDLRFLRNPHWDNALRSLTGQDEAVGRYIKEDPLYEPFLKQLTEITSLLLPAYKAEGKSYFSLGLGCTGGQHRSVFVAGIFANALAEKGWQVSIRHRELERGERLGRSSPGTGVE